MEGLDYAFGAIPFPAAGIGAPHIRDRLYWLADTDCEQWDGCGNIWQGRGFKYPVRSSISGMAYTCSERLNGFDPLLQWEKSRRVAGNSMEAIGRGPINGFWRSADWISCRDDRWRPVEPGTFPLVDGASARMGRLRAYGNAINAQAAIEFIRSTLC
jgi:DNA (cytosine-5)-methyltransferase 1